MADNDYVSIYRQFFEDFAKTFQAEECRPMRVNLYNLSTDELVGEVMQSCVNYLTERKCPKSLIVPLTKIVVEEFLNEVKKEPLEVNTPLKLNKKTHDKISEVCLRYTDNERMSSLPGPVAETDFSTHSTKHTRRRMEDRLICLPRFNTLHGIKSDSEAGFYAIFDGHGGVNAACYAVSHLHQFLAESEFYPEDPVKAFREAFEKTDSRYKSKDENSGTAVLALLHRPADKKLVVSWVGDSQAMLVSDDSYVMLVDPHKPERKDEAKRIENLGGFITKSQSVYRVNGGLAISRAIGDIKLKPFVCAEPEIRVLKMSGSEHFIVMGCDGFWDVVDPQEVIDTVYFEVKKCGGQIDTVAKRLVDLAKENNSTDNISVIVIFLIDPADIRQTVDGTGHRPKILVQDGVTMEADIQASEKPLSAEGEPDIIFEAEGGHSEERTKTEPDDDFGPETDVDALDDSVSFQSSNSLSSRFWIKAPREIQNSDILIEFACPQPSIIAEEPAKLEDFNRSQEHFREEITREPKVSDTNKFSGGNVNPFEISDVDRSDVFNFSNNNLDDNKYREEMNSKKEKLDFVLSSDITNRVVEIENETISFGKSLKIIDPQNSNSEKIENVIGKDSFATGCVEINKEFSEEHQESKFFSDVAKLEDAEKSVQYKGTECFSKHCEETSQSMVGRTDENLLVLGSEPEKNSSVFYLEKENVSDTAKQSEEEKIPSPLSAFCVSGETKDDIVAESGGEVEDSEDEWNYIKVKSINEVSLDNNTVSSESEKSAMNWSLNPNAAEFVPVAPVSMDEKFPVNVTPKKAIPQDLTDIVASSPNWTNMENIKVPDEKVFLDEIKSRPSNILENTDSPQQTSKEKETIDEQAILAKLSDCASEEYVGQLHRETSDESETERLEGIALATDMTSSFIDPSTMTHASELPNMKFDLKLFSTEESQKENYNDSSFNENLNEPIKEPTDAETIKPTFLPEATKDDGNLHPNYSIDQNSNAEMCLTKCLDVGQLSLQPEPTKENELCVEKNASKESSVEIKPLQEIPPAKTIDSLSTEKEKHKTGLKKTTNKASKSLTSVKPSSNEVKASPVKTSTQSGKVFAMAKSSNRTTATKTNALGMSCGDKSIQKTATSSTPSANKVQLRTKTSVAPTTTSRPSESSKPATSAPAKSASLNKVSVVAAPKPKPRIPSAPVEKKSLPKINGDVKPSTKRPELSTRKTTVSSASTAATTSSRPSVPSRPATAPSAKPANSRISLNATRAAVPSVPSVPSRTTPNPSTPVSKVSAATKKSALGPDKQAKELANRIASRSSSGVKTNGLPLGKTTASSSKTIRKSPTTPKTKTENKTEPKAENLVEIIQRENDNSPKDENKETKEVTEVAVN